MFTHNDFKGAERVGCAFVIVALLLLLACGFMLGRCTKGYSVKIEAAKEQP